MSKKNILTAFFFLIVVVIIGFLGFLGDQLFVRKKLQNETGTNINKNSINEINPNRGYEVVLEKNSQDPESTDVYLKDVEWNKIFFLTLKNVYREHYHNTEYQNGNLYIIIRKDETRGDILDTDELWRYNLKKEGAKLYSKFGLDFRVTDDENYILVVIAYSHDPIVILDPYGTTLYSFTLQEIAEIDDLSGTYAEIKQWNPETKKFEITVKSTIDIDALGIQREYKEWFVEIDPQTGELKKRVTNLSSDS